MIGSLFILGFTLSLDNFRTALAFGGLPMSWRRSVEIAVMFGFWDGVAPLFRSATHGDAPPLHDLRELIAYIEEHRGDADGRAFDVVVGGASPADPAAARDLAASLADAGATWWDERQHLTSDDVDKLEPVLRRIELGPPRA